MKIPEEVRFMSSVYRVIQEPGYSRDVKGNNYGGYQGTINYNKRTIHIDPELPNSNEVFFHEIVHMINHHLSISMDEKDVERLGEGLFHFLKENRFI
jgi:hypothetical protein